MREGAARVGHSNGIRGCGNGARSTGVRGIGERVRREYVLRRAGRATPWRVVAAVLVAGAGMWVVRHIVRVRSAASAPMVRVAVNKAAAQDLYLQGRYLWNLRTEDSLTKAVDLFTQAIVQDPRYAPAYAGLADSYLLLRQYGHMTDADAFSRAYSASRQALALDESSAEAHRTYAFVLNFWLWNTPAAEAEFHRAIALAPQDAQSHHWYATTLYSVGRYRESVKEIDIARTLAPDSVAILANRGLLLDSVDRAAGLAYLLELEKVNPGFASIHRYLSAIYLRSKQYPAFLDESRQNAVLLDREPEVAVIDKARHQLEEHGTEAMFAALAKGYGEMGDDDHSQDAMIAAMLYAQLGDTERALHYLTLAATRRESYFHSIGTMPEFNSMRGNPAFEALVLRSRTPFAAPAEENTTIRATK